MSAPVGVVMRRGAELAAARRVVSRTVRRCSYCGQGTYGLIACRRHRDLVKLDPFFTLDNEAEPVEDFRREALPDRLQRTGV